MIETGLENHRNGLEKVLNLVIRKVWEPCGKDKGEPEEKENATARFKTCTG